MIENVLMYYRGLKMLQKVLQNEIICVRSHMHCLYAGVLRFSHVPTGTVNTERTHQHTQNICAKHVLH